MDVELREVRDFLAAHPPFSALPSKLLDELPGRLHVRYFRRGTTIIDLGAANNSLYLLRSGAVDIHRSGTELVERADPGTSFGTSSLLSRQPSEYRIVAIEDSLVLVMPGEVFADLAASRPEFAEFFGVGAPTGIRRAVAELREEPSGRVVLQTRVADLAGRRPVTGTTGMSIQEAAQLMAAHRVSALLIVEDARVVGIMTDRDLRGKVVAAGLDPALPVTTIMTPDPLTIPSTALAFEAMLEMLGRNVHHLPVVDAGRLVGLVSAGDLMRLETANPVFLVGDIAKQATPEGVATITARLPRLVVQLVAQDASAEEIHRLITAVSDAATRRLLELAEADLGAPPVPYEWLVLGSQARQEHGLGSDQDHVLLLDDAAGPEADPWFAALAERVTSGLGACGYPRCPGEVMATNPRWRLSLASWRAGFAGWIGEPEAAAVLHAQIFFDSRAVHGRTGGNAALRQFLLGLTPRSPRFLGHLAAQAVERQPPIGFFRGFVLERQGEHRDTLDLKSAMHIVIELARLYALAGGLPALNTVERLRAAAADGLLSESSAGDLVDAFEFLGYLRLRHQAGQVTAGRPPDNRLAPDSLTSLERKHLRDVFGILRTQQQGAALAHHTQVMS
jgi:CBS domain-containing protein